MFADWRGAVKIGLALFSEAAELLQRKCEIGKIYTEHTFYRLCNSTTDTRVAAFSVAICYYCCLLVIYLPSK